MLPSGIVAVVELDSVKLKPVPAPSSANEAGVGSKPVIWAIPVPLIAIEVEITCPSVKARRSKEKVVVPIVNVHAGMSGAVSIAAVPSPMKVKSPNVAAVPKGTAA